MPVIVLPVLIPDIEKVYDVYFAAFNNEPMAQIMLGALFPGGITPEFRKSHTAATLDWWHKSTDQYTAKVVDVDTGEIIGMILADVFIRERTEEERKFQGIPWLEGAEKERAEAIVKPLSEMREKLFGGRKYICKSWSFWVIDKSSHGKMLTKITQDIHAIGIRPDFQGLKAGAALVEWGIQTGDPSNLPIYIEASPSTWKLYERFGFQKIDEKMVHKKELTRTEEDIEVPLMVRMPAAAKGMTFDEWRKQGYPAFK